MLLSFGNGKNEHNSTIAAPTANDVCVLTTGIITKDVHHSTMSFTLEERVFLVLEYDKCFCTRHVRKLFRDKFGRKKGGELPSRHLITFLHKKFKKEGTVLPSKRNLPGGYRVENKEEKKRQVENYFSTNPGSSTRKGATALGMSRETVRLYLKKNLKLKPYKIQRLHKLYATDPAKRVDFARRMKEYDEDFTKDIFFSDESTFSMSGRVNTHNVRIWGSERPHDAFYEFERNAPKVNVYCAMNGSQIIGPYFFPRDTVNGADYVEMLTTWLLPRLGDKDNVIYQMDGAPGHWFGNTRALLNETFPGRWIGRASNEDNCLMRWPPRSPDITPLDFFLWGYVKDAVFTLPLPQTVDDLKRRITEAIHQISQDLLQLVHSTFRKRLNLVIKKKGLHVEKR